MRLSRRLYARIYPGVSTRVTLPFLIIILIVAGIGTLIVTRLVAGSIDERINNQLFEGAQAVTNAITDIERAHLATLRLMAFTDGVDAALASADVAALDRLLSGIAANQGVDELLVFDSAGTTIYRLRTETTQAPQLIDMQDWPLVRNILAAYVDNQGDKFVDLQIVDERRVVFFGVPVLDTADQLVGGIVVGISTRNFVQQLNEQSLSTLILIDESGYVIDTTIRALLADALEPPRFVPDPAAITGQIDGGQTPLEVRSINGIEYKVLYSRFSLRSSPFGLMGIAIPTDFVADQIGTSRDTFTLLFSVMSIAVMVMGLLISRSILLPLFRIVDTTRAIRTGDLTKRVRLQLPDELGELSRSFDHMTDQLVAQNQRINDLYFNQLRETARRDAVLAGIRDIVIVQNNDGRMILHNAAARTLRDTLRDRPDDYRQFRSFLRQSEDLSTPRVATLADQHFSIVATPVRMPTGDVLGRVVVFRDITALIESQNLKDELILQLSHELRTPFATAYSYAELVVMLGKSGRLEQVPSHSEQILDQLSILGTMLNRVIEVSAIMTDNFALYVQDFDLIDLIESLIDEHMTRIEAAGITLIPMFRTNRLAMQGDVERLSTAFAAVLENAYHYTLEGGQIRLVVRHEPDCAVVEISDTGVGIPFDEQDKVFERLYRGSAADAGLTDSRGMGLGLYVTRHYVQAHKGNIVLTSEPGVGTTVTISLPLVQEGEI